tara:strand:+ start:2231 stop:2449 length:219 start_codon:yes stop_codon:yes gene_type:complete
MRIECKQCNQESFSVAKTYPHEGYTIRQLRCTNCSTNVFTYERVLSKDEYKWDYDNSDPNSKKPRSWVKFIE